MGGPGGGDEVQKGMDGAMKTRWGRRSQLKNWTQLGFRIRDGIRMEERRRRR